ncbi:MAG: DUF2029 domain-containing protein [Deltaproteobacteria bacterium]|nr:DUF2029 domain-containing protein [Deltaproteobacteria bacterium]MBI3077218.1 DUF2029 domain-containing protein [Deltaproteobacteria bacterium]
MSPLGLLVFIAVGIAVAIGGPDRLRRCPTLAGFLLGLLAFHTAFVLLYEAFYFPWVHMREMYQFVEEMAPLQRYLDTGQPIRLTNPRQYGPVFFLFAAPLTLLRGSRALANVLYVVNAGLIVLAFVLCAKACARGPLRWWEWTVLAIAWLNFWPLHYLLGSRNVEIWELALLAGGLYAARRGQGRWTGAAVGLATLIKMLPALFVYYFLWRERRVFLWSVGTMTGVLGLATLLFGWEMGLGYGPFLASRALAARSWDFAHYENVALKGLLFKAFAGFRLEPGVYTFRVVEPFWLPAGLAFAAQGLGLALLAWFALCRATQWAGSAGTAAQGSPADDPAVEGRGIEWTLVLAAMLLLSPLTAWEYAVLLLPGITAATLLLLRRPDLITGPARLLLAGGYVLVSDVLIIRGAPWEWLNLRLGNQLLRHPVESYKAYCLPTLGLLLFLAFAVVVARRLAARPAGAEVRLSGPPWSAAPR